MACVAEYRRPLPLIDENPRKRRKLTSSWDVLPCHMQAQPTLVSSGQDVGIGNGNGEGAEPSISSDHGQLSSPTMKFKARSSRNASPRWRNDDKDGHYIFELGENLTPRYKILSKMGEGTFGQVLECWDRKSKDFVAIKIVRGLQKYREAAMIEIDVLREVAKHDRTGTRCVQMRDWFDYRNHTCIVFEKLGPSLYDFLQKNNYRPFPIDLVKEVGRERNSQSAGRQEVQVTMGNMWWVVAGLLSLLLSGLEAEYIHEFRAHSDHPFAQIRLDKASVEIDSSAHIAASPSVLGVQGETYEWVTLKYSRPSPAATDWIAVFSPANFNSSTCTPESGPDDDQTPLLCSAPVKFQYANYSTVGYSKTGKGSLKLRLINQRADFAFALFAGGLSNPKLLAISNTISFADPKAPLYPRLAQGKLWNEMSVTWTSGYGIEEATPVVEWGFVGEKSKFLSPAGTLTYTRNMMCGQPARTVGWRDPGFIHTSVLKDLWPNTKYYYKIGHRPVNGSYIWGPLNYFKSSPYPGQDSLQRVIIYGDMGKAERDGSNAYSNYQPGTLNTTDRLIEDLENIDIVFHIGDLAYANGYLSQWDQFTAQMEPIASHVPYMVASGNHERDWPDSSSFYKNTDSGGECGVPAKTTFHLPTTNDAKIWYSTDYGMFHFCIADSELDWQEESEQYKFIEQCLASADRQKQPWLIFISHRVLGYSSNSWLAVHGAFEEPMGRGIYQKLWQKYKVDIAFFGHVHNYERSCPVYQNYCVSDEKSQYSGTFNATIHVVAGGGGSHLSDYTSLNTTWSIFKDQDFGFVKLTAFNHSALLFEYKRSSDGKVYDKFWITREYKDILGCDSIGNCPSTTLAQ